MRPVKKQRAKPHPRRRVHPDLEALAVDYPKLCRDATAWGEARATVTELRRDWPGGLPRVIAQLYSLGVPAMAISRVLGYYDDRDVYRELSRWRKRTGIDRVVRSDPDL